MYYRLFDKQTGCYMATGYNANSKIELVNDYKSYKSVDSFEEDDEEYEVEHEESVDFYISRINDDEFIIEESETPFDEDENPLHFD